MNVYCDTVYYSEYLEAMSINYDLSIQWNTT